MNPVEELILLRDSDCIECINQSISKGYLIETKEDLLEVKAVFDLINCSAQSVGPKDSWS